MHLPTSLHGAKTQKNNSIILTATKTSNLTQGYTLLVVANKQGGGVTVEFLVLPVGFVKPFFKFLYIHIS
jgi:hypothetical protein